MFVRGNKKKSPLHLQKISFLIFLSSYFFLTHLFVSKRATHREWRNLMSFVVIEFVDDNRKTENGMNGKNKIKLKIYLFFFSRN